MLKADSPEAFIFANCLFVVLYLFKSAMEQGKQVRLVVDGRHSSLSLFERLDLTSGD